jgi:hypothetical protein
MFELQNYCQFIGTDILFTGRKILESSEEPWQFMDVRIRQAKNAYFNTYANSPSQTMRFQIFVMLD